MLIQAIIPLRVEPQIPTRHVLLQKTNAISSAYSQYFYNNVLKKHLAAQPAAFLLWFTRTALMCFWPQQTAFFFSFFVWKIISKSPQYTICSAANSRQAQLAAGEQRQMFPSGVAGNQKQLKESQCWSYILQAVNDNVTL